LLRQRCGQLTNYASLARAISAFVALDRHPRISLLLLCDWPAPCAKGLYYYTIILFVGLVAGVRRGCPRGEFGGQCAPQSGATGISVCSFCATSNVSSSALDGLGSQSKSSTPAVLPWHRPCMYFNARPGPRTLGKWPWTYHTLSATALPTATPLSSRRRPSSRNWFDAAVYLIRFRVSAVVSWGRLLTY